MRNKLLYVDDEESNLRIFKSTFRRDYDVLIANSAKDGIKILKEQKVDVILSDQRMPDMTGVEFLQYAMNHYPDSIRMLITGYVDLEVIKAAINKAQIIHYIQKPWDELVLTNVIKNTIKIKHLENENYKQRHELITTAVQINRTGSLINYIIKYIDDLLKKQNDNECRVGMIDIRKTLRSEIKKHDNWELFKTRFIEVHPTFFNKIKTAHPDLSRTELRYFSYLRIDMPSSEIAHALNVSTEAIKKTRYRIRKKIGLERDLSLENYISRF